MNFRYGEDVYVAEICNKFPEGTQVLLFGVDGIPDNTRGVVDFVDDVGCIFVETEGQLKNAVLRANDEGTYFVKDTVNFSNVLSDKVCAVEEIEVDDVVSSFAPLDLNRKTSLCGFSAFAHVTDSFVGSVPEYEYCLSDDNDHFVNGYVTWNLDNNVVKLYTFLNDDSMRTPHKEFVLNNKDREFVVNEFNKFYIENYGMPAKSYFTCAKSENLMNGCLSFYDINAAMALNDEKMLKRCDSFCKFNDLSRTRDVLNIIFIKEQGKDGLSLDSKLGNAVARSVSTDSGRDSKMKEGFDYGK